MDMNLSKLQEIVKDRGVWHAAVHRVAESEGRRVRHDLVTEHHHKVFQKMKTGQENFPTHSKKPVIPLPKHYKKITN